VEASDVDPFSSRLPAVSGSVPRARAALDMWLRGADVSQETRYAAALCVSELVANVVMHAYADGEGSMEIRGVLDGDLEITVTDSGMGFVASRENGRDGAGVGLRIVESLSREFSVTRSDGRTVVSARIVPVE
jgi:serine/threonine-protein kinase RsbW